MAVLKTTSPVVLPFAPTETPRNTVPSSRASTAGVDTPVPRFALRHCRRCAKREALLERLPLYGLIRDQFPGANINDAKRYCPCLLQTQDILHGIKPRRSADQPPAGLQRAAGENHPIGGPVRELDPFAGR